MFFEILVEVLRKNLSKMVRVVKGFLLYLFVVMGVIGFIGGGLLDGVLLIIIFLFLVISFVIIFLGFLNFLVVISNILLYVG